MGVAEIPSILFGKVMHARLSPKVNKFRYGIYYLSLPLTKIKNSSIAYNRLGVLSFYDRDHGPCDGSSLEIWVRAILKDYGFNHVDGDITLICMPRVLGYVFNPVSFYLCRDKDKNVRAIICEVHNTFGERHSYLCAHSDQRPITEKDVLEGKKLFHVSPFLEREGHYTFRFDTREGKFGTWINFYDNDGNKKLITSLIGEMQAMDKKSLRQAFLTYPLVTFKAIMLIHWQAIKIIVKGIRYIPKPLQNSDKISASENITKI